MIEGVPEYRWGRTTITGDVLEESFSTTKAWAEAWPHQSVDANKDTLGPVKLFRVTATEATDSEAQSLERLYGAVPPLSRGMFCSWQWDNWCDDKIAQFVTANNIRPLGKIITSADLPRMRGCEFAIQLVDNTSMVFDVNVAVEISAEFLQADDTRVAHLLKQVISEDCG